MPWVLRHQDLIMFGIKLLQILTNFHTLEVVICGSETQIQASFNVAL